MICGYRKAGSLFKRYDVILKSWTKWPAVSNFLIKGRAVGPSGVGVKSWFVILHNTVLEAREWITSTLEMEPELELEKCAQMY